ncbi:hypothetical protein EK21DRAFT_87451 [Setomelanomma holmii]|uniref:C2H2-type domain-containing protein n=1 Tax=Setomelanomma holmii TaxID=210430 RepID=A0A9P4LPC5_9PLEO|nr:hypothetical protein EK21DRAFT_87451 [Setomelanomma holmii]
MSRELHDGAHDLKAVDDLSPSRDDTQTAATSSVTSIANNTGDMLADPFDYRAQDSPWGTDFVFSLPEFRYDSIHDLLGQDTHSQAQAFDIPWSSTHLNYGSYLDLGEPSDSQTAFEQSTQPLTYASASTSNYLGSHPSSWIGSLESQYSLSCETEASPALGGSTVSTTSSASADVLSCHTCGARFTGRYRRGNRARHERLNHGSNKTYHCEAAGCEKTFLRQDARLKHYRKRHPDLARNCGPTTRRHSVWQDLGTSSTDKDQDRDLLTTKHAKLSLTQEPPEYDDVLAYTTLKQESTRQEDSSMTSVDNTPGSDTLELAEVKGHSATSSAAGESSLICIKCRKSFQRPADLRRHMHQHEDPKFSCEAPGCVRTFYRKDKLRDHVDKMHDGTVTTNKDGSLQVGIPNETLVPQPATLHICSNCGKHFETQGQLNRHVKTHSKPYQCDECEKSFALNADLKRHKASHASAQEAACHCEVEGCDFETLRRDNLRRHMKNQHGVP